MQCDDPEAVASRWPEIAEIPVSRNDASQPSLELDNVTVCFVACAGGRPEGSAGWTSQPGTSTPYSRPLGSAIAYGGSADGSVWDAVVIGWIEELR